MEKFKLVYSKYGNTVYESENFVITKLTHSPSHANVKYTYYRLSVKNNSLNGTENFSKFSEAKEYANSEPGKMLLHRTWSERRERK